MSIDHTWLIVGQVLHFVLVVLVLVAVLLALRMWFKHRVTQLPRLTALGELELRYARGEATREDFLMRRADLDPGTPPAAAAPPVPSPPATA